MGWGGREHVRGRERRRGGLLEKARVQWIEGLSEGGTEAKEKNEGDDERVGEAAVEESEKRQRR